MQMLFPFWGSGTSFSCPSTVTVPSPPCFVESNGSGNRVYDMPTLFASPRSEFCLGWWPLTYSACSVCSALLRWTYSFSSVSLNCCPPQTPALQQAVIASIAESTQSKRLRKEIKNGINPEH